MTYKPIWKLYLSLFCTKNNKIVGKAKSMTFLKFLQSIQNNHNEKMVNSKEFYETLE